LGDTSSTLGPREMPARNDKPVVGGAESLASSGVISTTRFESAWQDPAESVLMAAIRQIAVNDLLGMLRPVLNIMRVGCRWCASFVEVQLNVTSRLVRLHHHR